MARTSLRAYHRDIEELIETHQYDQAIAHCRHILRFYPKDVNTYRLLGKTYLEAQRYGDASDIFIRVLSTIPDDFVSHVGMSIVREDEGNLDEAIWHMQRAFETQPANSAIQAELRRLHGRREGVEPPKVRLTRGALARMYLKGELYSQALAELRAGLHEDPKRYDLQVVLAQAYYMGGQRVDAAETCSTLLKSLPYCFEANRILADILSHSERVDEVQVYAKRVQSLDPYMAHIPSTASTSEKVSDSAVLLEKLEWRSSGQPIDESQQTDWAISLGVDLGSAGESDGMPDWLGVPSAQTTSMEMESIHPFEEPHTLPLEPNPVGEEFVPDWMKDSGWTSSQETGELDGFLPLSESEDSAQDIELAEIPAWLKSMAPAASTENQPGSMHTGPLPTQIEDTSQAEFSPWMEEPSQEPTDNVAAWLEKEGTPTTSDDQPDLDQTNIENFPDWLDELEPSASIDQISPETPAEVDQQETYIHASGEPHNAPVEPYAAVTAALGLTAADRLVEEPEQEAPAGLVDEMQSEAVMSAEISDWLRDLEPAEVAAGDEPDYWASAADSTTPTAEEPLLEAEIPDWLQDLEPSDSIDQFSPEAPAEVDQQETYIQASGEPHNVPVEPYAAVTATLGLRAADRIVEEPGQEASAGLVEEMQSEAVMSAEISDWLRDLEPAEVAAGDEADNWASAADSTTPTAEEPLVEAEIPEWLQDLEPAVDEQASLLETIVDTSPDDTLAPVEEKIEHSAPVTDHEEESRGWAEEAGGLDSAGETPLDGLMPTTFGEPYSTEDDAAFAWLENLAVQQGADEALILTPEERRDTPPDWLFSPITASETWETDQELTPDLLEASIMAAAVADRVTEDTETTPSEETISVSPEAPAESVIEIEPVLEPEPAPDETLLAAETVGDEMEELGESPIATASPDEMVPSDESEMLFYPSEFDETSEKPIILDESPVEVVDTKPVAVKPSPLETIETIAIGSAVIESISGRDEEPAPETTGVPAESAGEPVLVNEQIQIPEPSPASEELVEAVPHPEIPVAEGVVIPEEDEAFAWLENLAARQGAEEALLLAPEDRLDTPPEWVVQESAEGDLAQPTSTTEETQLPGWLQETPEESQEPAAAPVETDVPDWLKQPAAISEETTTPEEPPAISPELPLWLAGIEESQKEAGITAWSAPEESLIALEPDAVQDSPESPLEASQGPSVPVLDLNQAGLIDLERLPGVGYTRAQAILEYREQHGPYQDVDELLNVTGITTDLLFELKPHLSIGEIEVSIEVEPPAEDHQILLVQARNALVQGDIPLAISRYGILIEKNQMLDEVIADLNEALYRFPLDVPIWEALGDAHMHAGHLQAALDAYTKAEEYLH